MANNVQKPKKRSSRPVREERQGGAKNGLFVPKLAGSVALFFLILYLISPGFRLSRIKLTKGEYASKSVLAQIDFEVADRKATEDKRKLAADMTPPVYVLDQETVKSSLSAAQEQLVKLEQDILNPVFSPDERVALISKYLPTSTSVDTLSHLANMDRDGFNKMKEAVLETLKEALSRGVLSESPPGAKEISLYDRASRGQIPLKVDQAVTLKKVASAIEPLAARKFPNASRRQRVLRELVTPFMRGTLSYDEKLTQLSQEQNRASVPTVMKPFKKNQGIIEAGSQVTDEDLDELEAHALALSRAKLGKSTRLQIYAGNALLLLLVFCGFLLYLYRYRPEIARNGKSLVLIGLMALITLGLGRVPLLLQWPTVFFLAVPIAAGAILLCALVDDRLALIFAFFISILYAVQGGNRFDLLLFGAMGGLAGVYCMRTIRKRSDVFWPGIVVLGVNAAAITSLNLVGILTNDYVSALVAGLSGGLFTAIGVLGLLIPLEYLFGIATNIRLLELSDLNNPLLKRLAMQAPGTYHHSLMVGNLAEAAAEQVNANSILARVGSYYHDVGKISKPLYFSENQHGGKNRHDDLSPNMSSLILIAHVKEGVELAREHRLNEPIIDLIQQHHGTSLMPYFYQKAMEQDPSRAVDEENFRYVGPKPQTREAAICLLADSVEAASRAFVNPTHGRIKGLVEKIINNKFVDSQLDECDLTLKDLHKIADSFVRVLAGYLHSRVEYPEEQTIPEIKEKFENIDTKVTAKPGNKYRAASRGD